MVDLKLVNVRGGLSRTETDNHHTLNGSSQPSAAVTSKKRGSDGDNMQLSSCPPLGKNASSAAAQFVADAKKSQCIAGSKQTVTTAGGSVSTVAAAAAALVQPPHPLLLLLLLFACKHSS